MLGTTGLPRFRICTGMTAAGSAYVLPSEAPTSSGVQSGFVATTQAFLFQMSRTVRDATLYLLPTMVGLSEESDWKVYWPFLSRAYLGRCEKISCAVCAR
eukprot:2559674-Rhodomonas_salina.5